jgi:phosphohistidine phosphatase
MKLYLVRHATATEGLGGNIRRDADRPLVPEGRQEAERVAKLLKSMGVRADALISSPYVRARQTAEIFAEVLGGKANLQLSDLLAPGGSFSALCKEISELKRAEEVFLFGHMPDMTRLAQAFLFCDRLMMPFKKSAVCRIDLFDLPPSQPGTLKWMITPKIAQALTR